MTGNIIKDVSFDNRQTNLSEMKVRYSRFRHNAKPTSFTSPMGPRRQGGGQEHAQYLTNHDVMSGRSCRRPENVSILSSLISSNGYIYAWFCYWYPPPLLALELLHGSPPIFLYIIMNNFSSKWPNPSPFTFFFSPSFVPLISSSNFPPNFFQLYI